MDETSRQNSLPPSSGDWESSSRVRALVHMAVTLGGLYVCYLLTLPFLPAIVWATTLAILFYPIHRRITRYLREPNLAALISVLLIAAIVVVPGIILGERIMAEAGKGAALIKEKLESGEWQRTLDDLKYSGVGEYLADFDILSLDIPSMIGSAVAWVANMSASLVRISVIRIVILLITFYFLFYFLRDRSRALRMVCSFSPLSARNMARLFMRVVDTVYATVYGTIVVAIVQGTLGGLIFWWLDLPVPVLWGVVMGMLAIVPVLGAFVIWIPAALFFLLDGNWLDALILTVWGTVVIGGIDNVLYPILVGNRLHVHSVPAFIAIVGGLIVFGASGIILGPLALTVTLFLVEVWREKIAARPLPDLPP